MIDYVGEAETFVESWEARLESGKDATTMTYLLSNLLRKVAEQARASERERIVQQFSRWITP